MLRSPRNSSCLLRRATSPLPAARPNCTANPSKPRGWIPSSHFKPPTESRHSRARQDLSTGVARAQSRQLSQFIVFEFAGDSGDGRTGLARNERRRRPGPRNHGRRSGSRLQSPRRYTFAGEGRRRSAAGCGLCTACMGEATLPGDGTLTCLLQKNLRTWATPLPFIPSWLK